MDKAINVILTQISAAGFSAKYNIIRLDIRYLYILSSIFFSGVVSAAAENAPKFCQAAQDYLTQVELVEANPVPDLDFSCFTDIPSISAELRTYQLVDIRNDAEGALSIPHAWKMPIAQLKIKSFLKKRQLLLIDESFSRVRAASNCAILKQHGFENIKVLVGGFDAWNSFHRNPRSPVDTSIKSVSAQQVLYEYFNTKVLLIALTKEISEGLNALGLDDHIFTQSPTAEKITEIVVTTSGSGFYPVVIVSSADFTDLEFNNPLPNLYSLRGGIESLSEQIQKNIWANHTRTSEQKRFVCDNS